MSEDWKDVREVRNARSREFMEHSGQPKIIEIRTVTSYRWLPYDTKLLRERYGLGRWQKLASKGKWTDVGNFPDLIYGDYRIRELNDDVFSEGRNFGTPGRSR